MWLIIFTHLPNAKLGIYGAIPPLLLDQGHGQCYLCQEGGGRGGHKYIRIVTLLKPTFMHCVVYMAFLKGKY